MSSMKDSTYETLVVNALGNANSTTLAKAADVPLRVLVSNVGAVVIFLAKSASDVAPRPTTASFRLFPSQDKVFVLAPGQALYAIGVGLGGQLSVSTSEALPGRE